MGGSVSRIWGEICAIQSDDIRAHMIQTTLRSPEVMNEARRAGIYGNVLSWLTSYQQGARIPFPYNRDGTLNYAGLYSGSTGQRDMIQHETPRWTMYTTPVTPAYTASSPPARAPPVQKQIPIQSQSQSIVVSPAAKAMDTFQESLELLGIPDDDSVAITHEELKSAYKQAALRAHPDKGGSKEAFDAVNKAYRYVARILQRVNPQFTESAESRERMTATVTPATAEKYRADPRLKKVLDGGGPPVQLSAKKMDLSVFNKLFEENRLPDSERDTGYGDWFKSQESGFDVTDPRASGAVNTKNFESVMRQYAAANPTAITRYTAPEAIAPTGVTELGGEVKNYTAAFGSDTQFTDLKEAYTTGATMIQEVAHVHVDESRRVANIEEAQRIRAAAMARVDPDEKARIQAQMDAEAQRELQRRLRLAKQDTALESWHDNVRRRLLVNQ